MMQDGGHMMHGWYGGAYSWLHPVRGVLGPVLMAATIAAPIALTRYLSRLGDRAGHD